MEVLASTSTSTALFTAAGHMTLFRAFFSGYDPLLIGGRKRTKVQCVLETDRDWSTEWRKKSG